MSGRPSVLRCCSEWSFLAVLALLLPVIAGHAPFLCALIAGSESSENAAATIDELFADIITIIIVGVFVCVCSSSFRTCLRFREALFSVTRDFSRLAFHSPSSCPLCDPASRALRAARSSTQPCAQ
jgi:hypothetical protein